MIVKNLIPMQQVQKDIESRLSSSLSPDPFATNDDENILSCLNSALGVVLGAPNKYEKACPVSTKKFSAEFSNALNRGASSERDMAYIFYVLSCCVRESSLRVRETESSELDVLAVWYKCDLMEYRGWQGVYWIAHDFVVNILPVSIADSDNSLRYAALVDVDAIRSSIEDTRVGFTAEVESARGELFSGVEALEERVRAYSLELAKVSSGYNFCLISDAFKKMLKEKKVSYWVSFLLLSVLGVALMAAPVVAAIEIGSVNFGKDGWVGYLKLIPYLAAELVLIYFFRVVLVIYSEIRAQLNNLLLRLSLCQFIEDYMNFAKDKGEFSGSRELFERLIFSPLPGGEKNPTPFDGIESLAAIVKAGKP